MNTIKMNTSTKITYNYLFKIAFFYLFFFVLLYSGSISVGGMTIGLLWKIAVLAAILLPVSVYILKTKQIELFVLFAILLSIKMFFNISSFDYFTTTIGVVAKNLMFPILFLFFVMKLNTEQLIYFAKHYSIFIVLSFVPFMLGVLDPISEGYKLDNYGFEGSFGLIGVFGNAHAASESLGIVLIVLFYFFQDTKNKYVKLIYLGLLGLGIYELILTYARTGMLISFVGLFYLWIKEEGSKKFVTAAIFVVPIVFMSIYMYITNPILQMRMNDETTYTRESGKVREVGSGRPTIAKAALKNWYEEGFTGQFIGLGLEYGMIKMGKAINNKILAHNGYIQILQQEGIIGALLFLLYLYSLLRYILKRKTNKYYIISMALVLGYMAEMLVQGNFSFTIILLMAIFLTLLKKADEYVNKNIDNKLTT